MKRQWTVAYYAQQDGKGGHSHFSVKQGGITLFRTLNGTEADEKRAILAAAAPDLLEACRGFVDHCNELWKIVDAVLPESQRCYDIARNAISKAEGNL